MTTLGTNSNKRVLILIGGHLCTCPRAQKEASILASAGFTVTVAGVALNQQYYSWDTKLADEASYSFEYALDIRRSHVRTSFIERLKRKGAQLLCHYTGLETKGLFGYGHAALLSLALRRRAALTIAHSESTLWVIRSLHKKGFRVAADFEDWFSEDLPLENRTLRGVSLLRELEQFALQNSLYTSTTSRAMANALTSSYRCPLPLCVYNSFPPVSKDLSTPRSKKAPLKIVWFSQTIGFGRGLEIFLEAIGTLDDTVTLTLIGNCTPVMQHSLRRLVPESVQSCITFLPLLPPWELAERLTDFDLGLALETNRIKNKNVTISNKLFQYCASGLAVLATATTGQQEIWPDDAPPGILVSCDDSAAIRRALQTILANPDTVCQFKKNALHIANRLYLSGHSELRNTVQQALNTDEL